MDDFDLILDDCLARLSSGVSTLEECLMLHPAHAAQLRPLLHTASGLARGRDLRPSPAFKARARARLTLHMQAHPRHRRSSIFLPIMRLAMVTTVFFMVFLAAGTALAQGAMPGTLLYDWKLTSEAAWRAASSDSLAVDLALSARRVDEMLAVSADADSYALALSGYLDVLTRLQAWEDAESRALILPVLQSQQERLAQTGLVVPALDSQIMPEPLPLPLPAVPEILPEVPLPVPTLGLPGLLPNLLPDILP